MFSRGNQSSSEDTSSDAETSSSETSRTTATDSWYDVKSDTEQPQRQEDVIKNDAGRKKIVPIVDDGDDDESTDDGDDNDEDQTLIKQINSVYGTDDISAGEERNTATTSDSSDGPSASAPKAQTEKNEWSNPYWGPTTTVQSSNQNREASGVHNSQPATYRDNVKSTTRERRDSSDVSIISGDSFHTSGKCVSDQDDGQGNFLASKNSQSQERLRRRSSDNPPLRQILSSSDEDARIASLINQIQPLVKKADSDAKPWVNPYWSTPDEGNIQASAEKTMSTASSSPSRSMKKESSMTNESFSSRLEHSASQPFLTSTRTSENDSSLGARTPTNFTSMTKASELNDEPSKDTDEQISKLSDASASAKIEHTSWENPYWKDHKPSKMMVWSTEGLNSKDTKDNTLAPAKSESPSWRNPYWSGRTLQKTELVREEQKPWENSYWKDRTSQAPASTDRPSAPHDTTHSEERKSDLSTLGTKDDKPWENPYWKDRQSTVFTFTKLHEQPTSSPDSKDDKLDTPISHDKKDISWENPYWKDRQVPLLTGNGLKKEPTTTSNFTDTKVERKEQVLASSAPHADFVDAAKSKDQRLDTSAFSKTEQKPWENPYWKDRRSPATGLDAENKKSEESTSTKKEDKPWGNPYWKDRTSQAPASTDRSDTLKDATHLEERKSDLSTLGTKDDKPWENPYWKDRQSTVFTFTKLHEQPTSSSDSKDDKLDKPISHDKKDISWENPYWKDRQVPLLTGNGLKKEPTTTSNFTDTKVERKEQVLASSEPHTGYVDAAKSKDQRLDTSAFSEKEQKPWENPYWKDRRSPATGLAAENKKSEESTSTKKEDKPWENPYWKNLSPLISTSNEKDKEFTSTLQSTDKRSQTSVDSAKEAKPWENPYWKDHKLPVSTPSKSHNGLKRDRSDSSTTTTRQDEPWRNPYWSEKKESKVTSSKEEKDKPWENPYWKDRTVLTIMPVSQLTKPVTNTTPEISMFPKKEDKPWENPYWKDRNPLMSTSDYQAKTSSNASSTTAEKPWENPYWTQRVRRASAPVTEGHNTKDLLSDKDDKQKVLITTQNDDKPWMNPYWKDHTRQTSTSTKAHDNSKENAVPKDTNANVSVSTKQKDEPWKNPYWKDSIARSPLSTARLEKPASNLIPQDDQVQISKAPKSSHEPWESPYWKDQKSDAQTTGKLVDNPTEQNSFNRDQQELSTLAKLQDQPWRNPYSTDDATKKPSAIQEAQKPWENPYWKDRVNHPPRVVNQQSRTTNPLTGSSIASETVPTTKKDEKPWENPYWKHQTAQTPLSTTQKGKREDGLTSKDDKLDLSTPIKKPDEPWKNPYWKNGVSHHSIPAQRHDKPTNTRPLNNVVSTTTTPTTKDEKPRENPYWRNTTPQTQTIPRKEEKPWQNPYWKDQSPYSAASTKQTDDRGVITRSAERQEDSQKTPYWKDDKYKVMVADKQSDQPQALSNVNNHTRTSSTPSRQQNTSWVNPYWKENSAPAATSSKGQDKPWQNPYWKDSKPQSGLQQVPSASPTSTVPKKPDEPWKNPYWGESLPKNTASSRQPAQPWVNPYWKDTKPQNPIPSPQANGPWKSPTGTHDPSQQQQPQVSWPNANQRSENAPNNAVQGLVLDEVWTVDNFTRSEHAVPPIPSFYKRIYPRDSPSSSPLPESRTLETTKSPTIEQLSPLASSNVIHPIHDDRPVNEDKDIAPFTVESQGVAHYHPLTSSPLIVPDSRTNFPASPSTTRKFLPSPHAAYTAAPFPSTISPPIQEVYRAPTPPRADRAILQSMTFRRSPPSSPIHDRPITISSSMVSSSELRDIQNALRFLDISEDSIITIEKAQYASAGRIAVAEIPYASLNSLVVNSKGKRAREHPSSHRFQDDTSAFASHHDSRYPPQTSTKSRTVSGHSNSSEPFVHI